MIFRRWRAKRHEKHQAKLAPLLAQMPQQELDARGLKSGLSPKTMTMALGLSISEGWEDFELVLRRDNG